MASISLVDDSTTVMTWMSKVVGSALVNFPHPMLYLSTSRDIGPIHTPILLTLLEWPYYISFKSHQEKAG